MRHDDAVAALSALPSAGLVAGSTPVEEMARLRAALGGGPRLLVKRDDALPFGFGGNKVRKLDLVAARARSEGADTLLTVGGLQSTTRAPLRPPPPGSACAACSSSMAPG